MLENEKNRQVAKSQRGVGRREFIGAALGGAVAAGGLLSSVKTVSAAERATTGTYREEIRTPIVARLHSSVGSSPQWGPDAAD